LRAVSDVRAFDTHTELCRAYRAALNETQLHDGHLVWSDGGAAPASSRALARLARLTGSRHVVGMPLHLGTQTRGAVLVLDPAAALQAPELTRRLAAATPVLAGCLDLVQRAEPSRLRRLLRTLVPRRRAARWGVTAAIVATSVVLLLPWPHTVPVRCRLEPVERRFVAAPLAGTLERALVLPGAEVAAGQVLAVMDGRELRWELAGLEAELSRAEKQQEVALVRQESAAAQQAGLELQRLELKRTLLTHRLANLEVRSPLAGVIVSGDLSKAQHAPVEIGQVLFEVAPLDAMSAELTVREADASYVQPGQSVRLALDAWPRTTWRGTVDLLRPRAEQRDGQTVLVAEVRLDNRDSQLRPGMSGRGRILCGDRTVGWILFHRPVEALCQLAGW
jgi:RND family efflux transporter MFP subunit